jgi:hypothetical protein
MKMRRLLLAIVLPVTIAMGGCSINIGGSKGELADHSVREKQEKLQREKISRLNTGESLDVVQNNLGTPDFTEFYNRQNKKVKVLFYRTHRVKADGITTKDECTPLVFVDSKLDSWGERALAEL